jgi:tetratricopeptide (TPR) repeat protein
MNSSDEQLRREAREAERCYQVACEMFSQQKFKNAIDWFTKSINASEYLLNRSAYINRGIARMVMKQYNEAIADLTNPSLKLDEKHVRDSDKILQYKNLGYCYYQVGKINEAKNAYQKVISIDPYDSDATYMLAEMS